MKKTTVILLLIAFCGLANGQKINPDRALKNGPFRQNGPFGGALPPAGMMSALGRAALTSAYLGSANSIVLLESVGKNDIRNEIGLDDTEYRKLRAVRDEVRLEMMNKIGASMTRLQDASPSEVAAYQAEMQEDFAKLNKRVESAVTPEQLQKARTLTFQATGGLDSPFLNADMIQTLDLDSAQKEKATKILSDMEKERGALMEDALAIMEKAIVLGGPNISAEDRAIIDAEANMLEARVYATSQKLSGKVREILTDEQRQKVDYLMANRPSFLPPLPKHLREGKDKDWKPGEDSWKPGQGTSEERIRLPGMFPLTE